jgi:UDP-N-acetylglucosamine 2-epimerase (non-hydrolysing)
VDHASTFSGILDALTTIQMELPILFPAHPRTQKRISDFGFEPRLDAAPDLRIIEPLGYLQFLDLMMHARMVLTDSGGIQEETTQLGVPCLTIRENTERPITINAGTNTLVGTKPERIVAEVQRILARDPKPVRTPELWDGRAAERIVNIIRSHIPQ